MNILSNRLRPIPGLLLALMLIISSLAASPRPAGIPVPVPSPAGPAAPSRPVALADGPGLPQCPGPDTPIPPTCTRLQVFLLIDGSSSMLYNDQAQQRIEGVKNVLDILAKEYYLPAVEASAKYPGDPSKILPNIQVSFIHFSHQLLNKPNWKTINPQSIAEWDAQLKAFDADLKVDIDYSKAQATDFLPAFEAASQLAAGSSQDANCPRLVLLFTDGVPNDGSGNLQGDKLKEYMKGLGGKIQGTFNRSNDYLFMTTFGSGNDFMRFWNRDHKPQWEAMTKDSADLDPRRVEFKQTNELAQRMERIIGFAIGAQVYTLAPITGKPQQFTMNVPMTVESLRLTYYTIKPAASFTVTGPDGQKIQPDGKKVILTGEKTSIQVLEILNPAPGAYQITTTAAGGMFNQLLRFEKITAKLSLAENPWLQFNNGQIGLQLIGADGNPLAMSPQVSIPYAELSQGDQPIKLAFTPGSDTFTTSWMPRASGAATVKACAVLQDNSGKTVVLYNDTVGTIPIDPVTVQAGEAAGCVPSSKEVSVPLQLINGRTQQPAAIDAEVKWTHSLVSALVETQPTSAISAVEATPGQYRLSFKPASSGTVQFAVRADAVVDGENSPIHFYDGQTHPIVIQPPRQLKLVPAKSNTLGDRLSVALYRLFNPSCSKDDADIVFGRRLFGLLGPTQVEINASFMDASSSVPEPGIERFAVQLVSAKGGPSSETLNSWKTSADGSTSTLAVRSPGLGLYNVVVTDQGTTTECAVLESVSTPRSIVLISDYWEYVIVLALIAILLVLLLILFWRYRNKHYGHEIPLLLSAVVLVALNAGLINLIVQHAFECQFTCASLVDSSLKLEDVSLCKGVDLTVGKFPITPEDPILNLDNDFFNVHYQIHLKDYVPLPSISLGPLGTFRIVPALAEKIDPPLNAFRQSIVWILIAAFAVGGLIITLIVRKFSDFVEWLRSAQGRSTILTGIGLWLLFFVIFCGLFYYGPGR